MASFIGWIEAAHVPANWPSVCRQAPCAGQSVHRRRWRVGFHQARIDPSGLGDANAGQAVELVRCPHVIRLDGAPHADPRDIQQITHTHVLHVLPSPPPVITGGGVRRIGMMASSAEWMSCSVGRRGNVRPGAPRICSRDQSPSPPATKAARAYNTGEEPAIPAYFTSAEPGISLYTWLP